MGTKVVILGALSAVAIAVARRFAAEGAELALAARRGEELDALAADLKVRGAARVLTYPMDLAGPQAHEALTVMDTALGELDLVVLAYGSLTDQPRAEQDLAYAASELETNFTSAARWALAAAAILERQGHGGLVAIGSVAGDRGRQSNYVYGAAKAGLGVLMQGLSHRLIRKGARAILVKPGFIDTPMTAHLKKGGPLWSTPDQIAAVLVKASEDWRRPIVYAPWYWRFVMLIIRLTPARVFHKTRL